MKGEETPHEPLPESRFIPADERCPHPEWWSSRDGDSTECQVSELIAGLARGLQPEVTIETGSAHGQTTALLVEAIDMNGHGTLITFENDPERYRALFGRGWPDWVRLERDSLAGIPPIVGVVELAFFDSWPEYRTLEYQRFRPYMRPGSVCVFHDTRPTAGADRIPSGCSLREEIDLLEGLDTIHLPTPRGVSLAVVT